VAIMPNYKEIIDLLKRGATLEAQEKIADLREGALELQEENLELRKRVAELEQKLELRQSVVYRAPSYWVSRDGKDDGPYCQKCFDADSKLIRLQTTGEKGLWLCGSCNQRFKDSSYRPYQPPPRSGGSWMSA
jgi:ribosomal protein L37AE/L43A